MGNSIWNLARTLFVGAGLLASGAALASGTTTGGLPPAPEVDYSSLPDAATMRPVNQNGKPHQAFARLLADRTAVVPGEPFRLGVQLNPDPKWHSYWKSPGEVGQPLTIDWSLPAGASVAAKPFPLPKRFEQTGIVSYGYDAPMLLFSEVTLPAEHPPGMVEVRATTSWLICEANCIPGEASLTLPLKVVGAGDPAAAPTPWAPLFDHFAAWHPTPVHEVQAFGLEHALSQSAYRPGDAFEAAFLLTPTSDEPLRLEAEVGTWPVFTPIFDQYQFYLYETTMQPTDNGGVLVVMKADVLELESLPDVSRIGGMFQVQVGDSWVRTEYETDVPWAPVGTEVSKSTSPLWALGTADAAPPPDGGEPPEGEGDRGGMAPTSAPGSLPAMLGLAFLGGILLNVMPCVFPVLSLKLFGLVTHAHAGSGARRASALAYLLGILLSFWALAIAVVVLQATIGGIGWGFQFQSPPYVAALATVVFAFGLSLFGVFEIPVFGADAAAHAASRGGLAGDVMNGVFATLLATPCVAPFLGTAVGFAFSQPPAAIFLFFTVIGMGLAAPFVLVAFVPALLRWMPKPGAWMETFKQLLGFTLIAVAVWMVDIFADLVGVEGGMRFVAFLTTVGLGAWIYGRWGGLEQTRVRQLVALAAAVAVIAVGARYFIVLEPAVADCPDDNVVGDVAWEGDEIPWQPFSGEAVAALAGKPVFIDFTAKWCLTCKVYERTIIDTAEVREAMRRLGVVPLVADWTRRDPEITEWLQRYGRAGVPFYLVLPADSDAAPIALPEALTRSDVVEALESAATGG
jgi:thiol:disulfide interchange protein DsbD